MTNEQQRSFADLAISFLKISTINRFEPILQKCCNAANVGS
ncbi:MAG: hypothetical protein AAFY42_06455 [Pseudomonadota bacterium]